jgi:hypothetical protein
MDQASPEAYKKLSVILLQEWFHFRFGSIAARSDIRAASVVFNVTQPAAMLPAEVRTKTMQITKWYIMFFNIVNQKRLQYFVLVYTV